MFFAATYATIALPLYAAAYAIIYVMLRRFDAAYADDLMLLRHAAYFDRYADDMMPLCHVFLLTMPPGC